MKKIFKIILASLLSITLISWSMDNKDNSQASSEIKAIIFDVGNVLVKTDKIAFAKEAIGISNIVSLGATSILNFDWTLLTRLQDKVLDIIEEIEPQVAFENGQKSMHGNKILPGLMCHCMCGKLTDEQVSLKVQEYISKKAQEDNNLDSVSRKFKSETEINVLKKIVETMFDPEKLASFHKPIDGMEQILNEISHSGKYKLLILSNWSCQAYGCLKISKNTQEIFKYFNDKDIFVSGLCGVMKPDTRAYNNILNYISSTYNISAQECLIIDDQAENTYAAQQFCNMQAINFKDAKQLRAELQKLGVLQPQQSSSWFW